MFKVSRVTSILLAIILFLQLLTPAQNAFALTPIGIPTNLSVSISNTNDVSLKWEAVSGSGRVRYRVYSITDNTKELLALTSLPSLTMLKMAEGKYTIAVTTMVDNDESEMSNPINFEIIFPEVPAPKDLTTKLYNINDLELMWSSVPNAISYKIYKIEDTNRILVGTTTSTNKYLLRLPEGEHIYEVSAVSDRFGESKKNQQVKVNITYPKLLPPSRLTSNIFNGNDLQLSWESANYATHYNIYRINNGNKEFVTSTTSTTKYFFLLPEGDYEYYVSTVSDRFGESIDQSGITLKILFPEITAPSSLTGTLYNQNDVYLQWKSVDYATGYKIYEVTQNERKYLSTTTNTNKFLTYLKEGEHIYEVSAVSERFGESVFSQPLKVNIIYPEIKAPSDFFVNIENGNNLLMKWKSVEFANSYKIYEVINGERKVVANTTGTSTRLYGLTEGEHTYLLSSVSERFGESVDTNQISVQIINPEMLAPIAKLLVNADNSAIISWDNVDFASEYTVFKYDNGSFTPLETVRSNSYTVKSLPEGKHEFGVTANNEFFGTSPISNVVTADIKPILEEPLVEKPQVTGDNVELSWSPVPNADSYNIYKVIDGNLILVENTTSTNLTVEGLQPGNYEFLIVPVSNAGIEGEKYSTIGVYIEQTDITPPQTIANETDQWQQGEFIVEFTATDDQSGVAKTFYSINGSQFIEGTSVTLNEEGIHVVSFYSVDNAGNKETPKTTVIKVDKTPPVTVSDVTNNWNKDDVTVNLTATDDHSGVAKTYYSFNGTDFVEGTSFAVNEEGIKTVYFYSIDNAGNVESLKTVDIKIDKTAPETGSDVTNQWNKGEVTVNLTATDNLSGVNKTFYSLNGTDFVEGTSFTVNGEGIKTVYFYSVDNAGNVEEVKTSEVKIDTIAPETVSNVTEQWNKDDVTVNLTATDNLSGVVKTFYSLNGTDFVEGTSFTVSEEGIKTLYFYSVDNAGNVETTKTSVVKIDKTAPVVSWNLEKEIALDSALSLNYQASDALSGIAKESVTVNGQVYQKGDSVVLDQPGTYNILVKLTDHAGNTTTLEKTFVVYIPATLIVNPGVIKANTGDFTVKITLPTGLNVNEIDLSTATLNDVSAKSGTAGLVKQAKNGQFKFNRDDFKWGKGKVLVEFRVLLNSYVVVGSTYVEVK